jgi:hypothetical protein
MNPSFSVKRDNRSCPIDCHHTSPDGPEDVTGVLLQELRLSFVTSGPAISFLSLSSGFLEKREVGLELVD